MEKGNAIIPMVNDFLDARSEKKWSPDIRAFAYCLMNLAAKR